MNNKIMKSVRLDPYVLFIAKRICKEYNITFTELIQYAIEEFFSEFYIYTYDDQQDEETKKHFEELNKKTRNKFNTIYGQYYESKYCYDKGYMDK